MTKKQKFFEYRGKPLVRSGNVIYYGSMSDKYVVKIDILKNEKKNDIDIATLLSVHLLNTDPNIDLLQMIVKNCQKESLFAAIDIATAWLEHSNVTSGA